ncbi:hypothetical protein MTP99_006097 [Tenebrio molitor]|nr:hypothetical protein MTP99_006097 [Tenebrio molitor]
MDKSLKMIAILVLFVCVATTIESSPGRDLLGMDVYRFSSKLTFYLFSFTGTNNMTAFPLLVSGRNTSSTRSPGPSTIVSNSASPKLGAQLPSTSPPGLEGNMTLDTSSGSDGNGTMGGN